LPIRKVYNPNWLCVLCDFAREKFSRQGAKCAKRKKKYEFRFRKRREGKFWVELNPDGDIVLIPAPGVGPDRLAGHVINPGEAGKGIGQENGGSVHTSRRFPARRKRGSRERERIPKRAKAEEKEKASAQCPMAEGRRPPPRGKATSITRETATPRNCRGNRRERTVKPTGNKHATEAA
jgi:hypothetical protein